MDTDTIIALGIIITNVCWFILGYLIGKNK
jgi:hypothetical protein